MKRSTWVIFSLTYLVLFAGPVNAEPLAGMNLSLSYLWANEYKVTLNFYRDCDAIAAPSYTMLEFRCTSNPALNFTILQVPLVAIQEITPVCAGTPTQCAGGSLPGYQKNVYETVVTLPPANQWVVSSGGYGFRPYSQTVTPSAGGGGYIEVRLNTLDAPGNSSPVFTTNPIRMMCTGQQNIINHGAIDPDGDSLSYAMVTPFESSGTTLYTWIPPFSATQPVASNPPVTLDPVTGEIVMTPTMNIASLMLLKVNQWRTLNGVPTLIGTSYLDIKLNAITCNNQVPLLSGMDTLQAQGYNPGDTIFHRDVCLGDTVSFAIWGHDADTTNASFPGSRETFNIAWNQGIPQATFQIFNQDTDSAYALFNWIPTAADRNLNCFTVTVHDFACPYYGVQTYTYCMDVDGISASLTPDTSVCQGESVTFHAMTEPPSADYLWSIDGVPVFTPAPSSSLYVSTLGMSAGVHAVSVETYDGNPSSVCTGKAKALLTIHPLPSVYLGNDTDLAPGATILLDAGTGFSIYLWSTGQTGPHCFVDSSGTGAGVKTVWVKVTDSNGCTGTDTIRINFVHNPGIADPSADAGLQIVPNPSDGCLGLQLSHFPAGEYDLGIHTRDGRQIFLSTVFLNGENGMIRLSLDQIADGFYYVRISGAGRTAARKFILQRHGR